MELNGTLQLLVYADGEVKTKKKNTGTLLDTCKGLDFK
jgi:hypothetical protein